MLNKKNITQFIIDKNNIILLRFFNAMNGLEKKDRE